MIRNAVVVAGLLALTLSGCSGEPEAAPPTKTAPAPSAASTTAPPAPDKLEDLTKGLDGKILAQHVDAKGVDATWAGRFAVAKSYQLHLSCIPGETAGEVIVKVSGGTTYSAECNGDPMMYSNATLPPSRKAYTLTVEVPFGAKWAVLVATTS